jgi:hypothetical protein
MLAISTYGVVIKEAALTLTRNQGCVYVSLGIGDVFLSLHTLSAALRLVHASSHLMAINSLFILIALLACAVLISAADLYKVLDCAYGTCCHR